MMFGAENNYMSALMTPEILYQALVAQIEELRRSDFSMIFTG